MPTRYKRINVIFWDREYAVIDRLARLTGVSKAQVVRYYMEGLIPVLSRTCALVEAANEAPAQVRAQMEQVAKDWEGELQAAAGGVLGRIDELAAMASREVREGSNPRTCNTGVRSLAHVTKGNTPED